MKNILLYALILLAINSYSQEPNTSLRDTITPQNIKSAQQSGIIKGKVTDEGQPIPFASILVKNSVQSTVADENGDYALQLPVGSYTIEASSIGYLSSKICE